MSEPSPYAIPITIGVIGHRDVPAAQQAFVVESIRRVVLAYREGYPESGVVVLTSLAEGADQLAVEACRGIAGVRILAVLPVPEEQYELDFTTTAAKDAFRECLDATWAKIVVDTVGEGPGHRHGEFTREAAYQACGRLLSRNSHVLIAVWDGRPPELPGGTADTVFFRVPGLVGLPALHGSEVLMTERPGPTLHIPVSRDLHGQRASAVDGGVAPAPIMELTGESIWRPWTLVMDDVVAQSIEDANREHLKSQVMSDGSVSPVTDALRDVSDLVASQNQRIFRRLSASVLILGAAGLVLVGLQQNLSSLWILASVVMTVAVVGALWALLGHLDVKRRFQRQRAVAEGARVQSVWLEAGVSSCPSDWYLQHQPEVGWIRSLLRAAWLVDRVAPYGDPQRFRAVTAAEARQIGDEWIGGQLEYFEGSPSRKGALARNASKARVYSALSVGGVALAFVALLPELFRSWSLEIPFTAVLASQSLWEVGLAIAAASTAYAELMAFREVGRRYVQSIEMFRAGRIYLQSAAKDLDPIRAAVSVEAVLTEVGKEALQETSAWIATSYERNVRPV